MEEQKRGRGRPKLPTTKANGIQEGEERVGLVMESELAEKLRNYAYTTRTTMREVITTALKQYLQAEEESGVVILNRNEKN